MVRKREWKDPFPIVEIVPSQQEELSRITPLYISLISYCCWMFFIFPFFHSLKPAVSFLWLYYHKWLFENFTSRRQHSYLHKCFVDVDELVNGSEWDSSERFFIHSLSLSLSVRINRLSGICFTAIRTLVKSFLSCLKWGFMFVYLFDAVGCKFGNCVCYVFFVVLDIC